MGSALPQFFVFVNPSRFTRLFSAGRSQFSLPGNSFATITLLGRKTRSCSI